MRSTFARTVFASIVFTCFAAASAAPEAPIPPDAEIDVILDALHQRGEGLDDFEADIRLVETDPVVMLDTTRLGVVRFQDRGNGDGRLYVSFDRREQGDHLIRERIDYLLDGGWLTEQDHRRRLEVRRQVLRPGEHVDLLRLGEGPFPLPIGQDKRDVHEQFVVEKHDPDADAPEGAVHIRLLPRPGGRFARDFDSIDVWVDTESHMPRRIETLDANQAMIRTTELENVRINQGLRDADFALPDVPPDWDRHDEPMVE